MKKQALLKGVALAAVVIGFAVPTTEASILFSTNYGDFAAASVTYLQVSESSITDAHALYGAPSTSGNTLNLHPQGFGAYSPDTMNGSDKTDGQLDFTVCADSGVITDLAFSERGDYSLFGFVANSAFVDVSAWYHVKILEVDGQALLSPVLGSVEMTFLPSTNGTYMLTAGNIPLDDGIWTGDMNIDLLALLDDAGESYTYGATKVEVSLDNHLTAWSQAGSEAFIVKKDFTGFSITAIPEPASMVLLIGTTSTITFIRRRFIG